MKLRNFIGGEWRTPTGARTFELVNPANGQALTTYSMSSAEDVDAAVRAAERAFRRPRLSRRERAELLRTIGRVIRQNAEELARLETQHNGKLYRESLQDDLPESADVFDYYAGWTDKLYADSVPTEPGFVNYTTREPYGVCALIVPWNFPLLLAMWKLAPALATGNAVVLKPSEHTPLTAVRLVELLEKELPPGLVNLVLGDGEAGAALARHPAVAKISFTGSTAVGREVVRLSGESNLKSVTLELGGKSPNILFADAPDLVAAVDRQFAAMFSHKGEKCSEPTRLLVERAAYDDVVWRLGAKAEAVRCGDPFDPATDQGAQCNRRQFDKILGYIESAKADGARLVAGGGADTSGDNAKGLFVRPTVFADVDNRWRVAQEEIFGPVLVVTPFATEEEAVALANDTPYGLAAGLYTGDVSRAHRVAQRLEAGMVFVNHYGCYDFASPFGGWKQSGWGKEMGRHSLDAYTREKSTWIKL